jgi:hypothetical protein
MEIKIGQIYFWNDEESFYGKAIRVYNLREFKRSDCTHVGIITDVTKDYIEIAEAVSKGFTISNYEKWWVENKTKEGKIKIGQTKLGLKNVREFAKKYEGIAYGWLDILGIGLHGLFGWKVLGLTGKNKIICSEAVVRILYDASDKKIDFEKEYKIKFDAITPEHIFLSKQVKI